MTFDLPPQFGGVGLHTLIRVVDEEVLGSWASVTANLVSFLRSKGNVVHDKLADAIDGMAEEDSDPNDPSTSNIPTGTSMLSTSSRAHAFLSDIPLAELEFALSMVLGERTVEIPGRYTPLLLHLGQTRSSS